ncbi:MAG: hypothetical protein CL933_13825 [Deltaproteobacteria bacterium]|nr:hypothetical protein [Deltaproteobacteria bacterium]
MKSSARSARMMSADSAFDASRVGVSSPVGFAGAFFLRFPKSMTSLSVGRGGDPSPRMPTLPVWVGFPVEARIALGERRTSDPGASWTMLARFRSCSLHPPSPPRARALTDSAPHPERIR